MAAQPLLASRRNHVNPPAAVNYWRQILRSQGYSTVNATGPFDKSVIEATRHFQMTRVDKNGAPLTVDGEVGDKTWWAGLNPSGSAQRNWLEPDGVPSGLSAARARIVRSALKDHAAGVREVPDGSNYGGGVTRYLEGIGPAFWCGYAVSTWCKDGTGEWPLGHRTGLVADLWNRARREGRAYTRDLCPVPGDAFILLYRNSNGTLTGLGHTGIVAAVGHDMNLWNAVEGNAGNRVKLSVRDTANTSVLVGFVDMVGDSASVRPKFSRGLMKRGEAAASSVASTR